MEPSYEVEVANYVVEPDGILSQQATDPASVRPTTTSRVKESRFTFAHMFTHTHYRMQP